MHNQTDSHLVRALETFPPFVLALHTSRSIQMLRSTFLSELLVREGAAACTPWPTFSDQRVLHSLPAVLDPIFQPASILTHEPCRTSVAGASLRDDELASDPDGRLWGPTIAAFELVTGVCLMCERDGFQT